MELGDYRKLWDTAKEEEKLRVVEELVTKVKETEAEVVKLQKELRSLEDTYYTLIRT
jgi:hypothetical protein